MDQSSYVARIGKSRNTIFTWLARLGESIFGDADEAARRHGWEVRRELGGLRRSYRDPRFDSLAACSGCAGQGWTHCAAPCPACGGSGRVRPVATSGRRL